MHKQHFNCINGNTLKINKEKNLLLGSVLRIEHFVKICYFSKHNNNYNNNNNGNKIALNSIE